MRICGVVKFCEADVWLIWSLKQTWPFHESLLFWGGRFSEQGIYFLSWTCSIQYFTWQYYKFVFLGFTSLQAWELMKLVCKCDNLSTVKYAVGYFAEHVAAHVPKNMRLHAEVTHLTKLVGNPAILFPIDRMQSFHLFRLSISILYRNREVKISAMDTHIIALRMKELIRMNRPLYVAIRFDSLPFSTRQWRSMISLPLKLPPVPK